MQPQLTDGQRRALNGAARGEACKRGDLRFLLHSSQLEVLRQFEETVGRFVLEKGRRWGGTWFLLALALMFCFRKPRTRVVYGAPTLKFLKEFVLPTLDKISLLLPESFRPKWNASSSHIECHNDSYVHLFGCDDQRQADTGAGSDADLAIFDEAGATGVAALLTYIITSIFEPQLMENVDRLEPGRVILGSSPPRIPEHAFTILAELAEAAGCYAHRSIMDNPRMTAAMIERLIRTKAKDEGLTPEMYVLSETWRREYLAERVVDKLLVVLPEWQDKRATCIQAVERPEFFDAHAILDPGGADPHAALFGYFHFPLAKWVIEDELLLRNSENSAELAAAVKAKESALYGTDRWDGTIRAFEEADAPLFEAMPTWMRDSWEKSAPKNPRVRWMDNNLSMCRDLYDLHGLAFIPTAKDDLNTQINNLRVMVNSDSVLIHPRCVHTDRHWRTTTWANHRRKDFARRAGEHGDLLACGIYGARNLDRQRNPFPPGYGIGPDVRDRRQRAMTMAEKWGKALKG
jgi:hypothetical protein